MRTSHWLVFVAETILAELFWRALEHWTRLEKVFTHEVGGKCCKSCREQETVKDAARGFEE